MGGDECLSGGGKSRSRCFGLLRGTVFFPFPRTGGTAGDRRFLYTRNGVLEADALPDPPWLSRALSFSAAATTSADESAGRFDGLLGGSSFGAGYSFCKGYDGDGDTAEDPVELEDRLICRLSFSI